MTNREYAIKMVTETLRHNDYFLHEVLRGYIDIFSDEARKKIRWCDVAYCDGDTGYDCEECFEKWVNSEYVSEPANKTTSVDKTTI